MKHKTSRKYVDAITRELTGKLIDAFRKEGV